MKALEGTPAKVIIALSQILSPFCAIKAHLEVDGPVPLLCFR